MEKMRKQKKKKKLVTAEKKKKLLNCFVSKPNYHTKNFFSENLLATEMKTNKDNHK